MQNAQPDFHSMVSYDNGTKMLHINSSSCSHKLSFSTWHFPFN